MKMIKRMMAVILVLVVLAGLVGPAKLFAVSAYADFEIVETAENVDSGAVEEAVVPAVAAVEEPIVEVKEEVAEQPVEEVKAEVIEEVKEEVKADEIVEEIVEEKVDEIVEEIVEEKADEIVEEIVEEKADEIEEIVEEEVEETEEEAEEEEEIEEEAEEEEEEEPSPYGTEIASGIGNASGNVTWTEYNNGSETVLVFSVVNSGASAEERAITISMRGSAQSGRVNRIVLEEGITGIGWTYSYGAKQGAEIFQGFSCLTTVNACSTLRQIGWSAFRKCGSLSYFNFSSCGSLEMIGQQAFSPAASLSTADLRGCGSLSYIGPSAFCQDSRTGLKVYLPAHEIATIGSNAFKNAEAIEAARRISIDYRIEQDSKAGGTVCGSLPALAGTVQSGLTSDDSISLLGLSEDSYQVQRGSIESHFPFLTLLFKGWKTENGSILEPGATASLDSLDSNRDGVATLRSVWSSGWQSGSGSPSANFSIYTDASAAQKSIANGVLLNEQLARYSPKVGGSVMYASVDGRSVRPDSLPSPSHGSTGSPNVGRIYEMLGSSVRPEGKYMMISYIGSSLSSADAAVRTLAASGYSTSDSESGSVCWKLAYLPSDAEVLASLASMVSAGTTVMKDENGSVIKADALTPENYSVCWCQVKYQSGGNDGWNINGVIMTREKVEEPVIEEVIENEEPAVEEIVESEEPAAEEIVENEEPAAEEIVENEEPEAEEVIENKEPAAEEAVKAEAPAVRIEYVPVVTAPVNTVPAAAAANEPLAAVIEDSANTAPAASGSPAAPALISAPVKAETVEIADEVVPLADFVPETDGGRTWALLDLLCLLAILYILLPLFSLKAKLNRISEKLSRGTLVLIAESAIAVLGVLVFVATLSAGAKMVLVDSSTILMALLTASCWIIDRSLREKKDEAAEA